MKIGVTDTMGKEEKFLAYGDWLKAGNPELEVIRLSYAQDNLVLVADCDGIVLTGGGDVDPRLYGGDPANPKIYGVDTRRDDFERKVLDATIRSEKPLLGICRGMQLTNVHLGGTLVQDLEDAGHAGHESGPQQETRHEIILESDSLQKIFGCAKGGINSYHHQAVDVLAPGMMVAGRSADGIIEMMEPAPGMFNVFMLFVQWHPERMNDTDNPFTAMVRKIFINAIQERKRNAVTF